MKSRNRLPLSKPLKRHRPARIPLDAILKPNLPHPTQIQMPIEIKERHDEVLIPALALAQLDIHHPTLQPMLCRQRLPLGAVLVDVRARLWRGTPVFRGPDALEAEPRADDGPALAPGRGRGRVGDVEGALRRVCGVQGGVDAELGDHVLGAVVGEDRVGLGSAREGARGAGAGDGGVEG